MGRPRIQLQELLEETTGLPRSRVHFQPPEGFKLTYPCVIYNRDYSIKANADNRVYKIEKRYLITVIDHDPDSPIPDKIEWLPQASFQRFFAKDQLNHYIFNLFF